jgi:hypothetical protein
MNQLFDLGYDMGCRGYSWGKYPPGLKGVIEVDRVTHYGKTYFQVRVIKERSART